MASVRNAPYAFNIEFPFGNAMKLGIRTSNFFRIVGISDTGEETVLLRAYSRDDADLLQRLFECFSKSVDFLRIRVDDSRVPGNDVAGASRMPRSSGPAPGDFNPFAW